MSCRGAHGAHISLKASPSVGRFVQSENRQSEVQIFLYICDPVSPKMKKVVSPKISIVSPKMKYIVSVRNVVISPKVKGGSSVQK